MLPRWLSANVVDVGRRRNVGKWRTCATTLHCLADMERERERERERETERERERERGRDKWGTVFFFCSSHSCMCFMWRIEQLNVCCDVERSTSECTPALPLFIALLTQSALVLVPGVHLRLEVRAQLLDFGVSHIDDLPVQGGRLQSLTTFRGTFKKGDYGSQPKLIGDRIQNTHLEVTMRREEEEGMGDRRWGAFQAVVLGCLKPEAETQLERSLLSHRHTQPCFA
jgi:hypothetical protein